MPGSGPGARLRSSNAASRTAGPTGDRGIAAFRWDLPRRPRDTVDLALELLKCGSGDHTTKR